MNRAEDRSTRKVVAALAYNQSFVMVATDEVRTSREEEAPQQPAKPI
jgi:hypothetical protein